MTYATGRLGWGECAAVTERFGFAQLTPLNRVCGAVVFISQNKISPDPGGGSEGGLVKDHTFPVFFLNPPLSINKKIIPGGQNEK